VSELNFSFSPDFSLGFIGRAHLKTVSTVYQSLRQSAHSEEIGKPLKRFRNFKRTLNPRLKPGKNEKLSFDTVSAVGGWFRSSLRESRHTKIGAPRMELRVTAQVHSRRLGLQLTPCLVERT